MIAMMLVNQLLFAIVYLIPVFSLPSAAKTALFLVCFVSAYIVSNLAVPQKSGWLISFVSDRARGIYTAKKEMVSLLGGMIFTFIAGNVIDRMESAGNTRMVFVIGSITVFALMALHAFSLIPVGEIKAEAGGERAKFKTLLKDRMFVKIVMVNVIWHIASCAATPFYGAYQIKELGFSMTFISIFSIAYSVVRMAVSPALGRFADRHSFASMVSICFMIAGAGFLVNCFTVPENGRILFTAYYCLSAASMGGINSAVSNLIYDHVKGAGRAGAIAVSSALGGAAGFLSTCLMSPVVELIQKNGNTLFGMKLYPAQFVSFTAFLITCLLIVYVRVFVVGKRG